MAKRLVQKNWKEIQEEMSIAGEPEMAVRFGNMVLALSNECMDKNNIPSIDNQIFALERVIAELKNWRKILYDRQHPKPAKPPKVLEKFYLYNQQSDFIREELPDVYEYISENDPIIGVLVLKNDERFPWILQHKSGKFSTTCESQGAYGTIEESIKVLESYYEIKIN